MGFRGCFAAFLMIVAAGLQPIFAQPAVVTISATATNSMEGYPSADTDPPVMYLLNRAGNIRSFISVNLSVRGTASNGVDYVPIPAQVIFPPGVTQRFITNSWLDDTLLETNEFLDVSITPGLNYIAGATSNAVITLLDNDNINYGLLSGQVFDTFVDGLGSPRKLLLDIYMPRTNTTPLPLVIWIFGGAWRGGDRFSVPTPVLELLTNGYAVASIDYRLSGISKWPAQVQDVRSAVRWLRINSARFRIDPQRIALWGASSGGHLALMSGFAGGRSQFTVNDQSIIIAPSKYQNIPDSVQAVVAWFPPTDFLRMGHFQSNFDHNAATSPESQLIGGSIQDNAPLSSTASPILYVHTNTPPVLLMHGTADKAVPNNQSELLFAQLHQFQRPAIFWPQVNLGHGGPGWADQARTAVIHAFLDRALKGATTNIPPTPVIRTGTTNSLPNFPVGFDASQSLDRDGTVIAYYWSFGDGVGSTNQIASHTYTHPGTYFVTLCVLDDRFSVASTGSWITVSNTPPSSGRRPTVQLIPPPTSGKRADALYFRAEPVAGDSPIALVQFFLNGTFIAQDFTPPYGVTFVAPRRGRVAAKAIDTAGRAANSTEIEIDR